MDWIAAHWLPLLFAGGYLLLLAYHGWHGGQKSKTVDHFFIGGRGLGGVLIGLSYYATFVSSVTFIGHAGKSYTAGPSWWLVCVVVFTTMVILSWFVVAPPFVAQARYYGALTIPHFLGRRYRSSALQRLAALAVVAGSVVYMAAVYQTAAVSLGGLFSLSHLNVMAVIFVVVTAYTLAGGFHSVVSTDAVQGLIMAVIAFLLPTAMIVHHGGLSPLLAAVREAEPAALEFASGSKLLAMVGLALGVGFKFLVDPRQLSRFYGLSSQRQLRVGRWIAPSLLLLTFLLVLPVGFLGHAYVVPEELPLENGDVQTDAVVPYLLTTANVLGPVLGAFFLTGLIAAAMSSLDSVLLVAASSVDHDLLKWGRGSAAVMRNTRIWIVLLSTTAAGVALLPGVNVVDMSSLSGTLYTASFLPTLVLGMFWRRGTTAGAIASLLVGFGVTLAWNLATKHVTALAAVHEMFIGPPLALAVFLIVSLSTRPAKIRRETAGQSVTND